MYHCLSFNRIEDCLNLDDGTDIWSQNVGKELPLLAAQQPRRAQFWGTVSDVRSFTAAAVYSIDFAAGKFGFRKRKVAHLETRKCMFWKLGLSVMGKINVNYIQRN